MAESVSLERARPRRAWRPLASLTVLAAVTALNNVDRGLFALLLPAVEKSIPLSDPQVGLLLGPTFMVVYSIAGLPIAWLADQWNRRTLIALGLAVWSCVTAATGAATRPLHLLVLRGALGLGEASNVAPTTALVSDLVPARQRALAFAVISAGTPIGTLLCFPLAGHIAATQGWRAACLALGLIGLATAVIARLVVQEPARAAERAPAPLISGVRGALGSLAREFARALRSRPFRTLIIAGGFFSCNYAAMSAWEPALLSRTRGLSVAEIGATLGVYRGGFGILASLLGGGLAFVLARQDERWIAWAPAGFCALIVPAELAVLFAPSPLWQAGLGLETFFLTAAIPCTFALLAQVADARARALWSACYFLAFNLIGQSLGPFSVGAASAALQPWFGTQTLRGALLIAPLSTACAAVIFLRLAGVMEARSRR